MHRYAIVACVLAAACIAPTPQTVEGRTPATVARTSSPTDPAALRREIEALNGAMVAAFKQNPASVASFYTDDARIVGGGTRIQGRQAVDAYWAPLTGFADWKLEVLDSGGDASSPWLLGRSTLIGPGGRMMITEYLGVLRRMPDGTLKYAVDFYTSAPRPRPAQ